MSEMYIKALNLVPTRVGMILVKTKDEIMEETCPHTRGDDKQFTMGYTVRKNLSPHAWG